MGLKIRMGGLALRKSVNFKIAFFISFMLLSCGTFADKISIHSLPNEVSTHEHIKKEKS